MTNKNDTKDNKMNTKYEMEASKAWLTDEEIERAKNSTKNSTK